MIKPPKPNLWQILLSVVGALLGVQSSRVQERDFSNGRSWWVYVLVAALLVLIFVILLVGIAKLIISQTPIS